MPHRFSEDDARRIFARAAERQRVDAPEEGLTLAELQEIGLAAGLDPTNVAAAVAEIQAGGGHAPGPSFAGIPSEWRRVRVLPVAVTDAAWERMVADLRRTFKQTGTPSQIGRVREWTASLSGHGSADGLRFALEPTDAGTRVTAEIVYRDSVRALRGLSWAFPMVAALTGLLPLLSGRAELWILPVVLAVIFAAVVGGVAASFRVASGRKQRDLDALLDRFDVIARDTAPEPPTGRLDDARLGDALLDDAPLEAHVERRRTRS